MLNVTTTVTETEIATGICDADLSLLAIASALERRRANMLRDRKLREDMDLCERAGESPVAGLVFLKHWVASLEAILRDDPEWSAFLPPADAAGE